MNWQGTPVCVVEPFAGRNNTNVPNKVLYGQKLTETADKGQVLFGNKCGHILDNPSCFQPPIKHKRRPFPIEEAKRNSKESFYKPYKHGIGDLSHHLDKQVKNDRNRRVRSEKRDAIFCKIIPCVVHYLHLKTMTIGHVDIKTGEFIYHDIKFIANKLNVNLRRASRIFLHLKKMGYIEIEQRRVCKEDGSFKSLSGILKVNPQLFYRLGITEDELNKYRHAQSKKYDSEILKQKTTNLWKDSRKARAEIKATIKKYINETPGKERKRHVEPIYRDLMKDNHQEQNINISSPVTAKHFIKNILEKLKPPC